MEPTSEAARPLSPHLRGEGNVSGSGSVIGFEPVCRGVSVEVETSDCARRLGQGPPSLIAEQSIVLGLDVFLSTPVLLTP